MEGEMERWRGQRKSSVIISPTKDGTLIAQLPCSPSPHSLCFLVISLSFLGKALTGKDLYGLLGLSAILGLLKKLPV